MTGFNGLTLLEVSLYLLSIHLLLKYRKRI